MSKGKRRKDTERKDDTKGLLKNQRDKKLQGQVFITREKLIMWKLHNAMDFP